MEHYICIHGHFYQPPRENAWLEEIEWQDAPYPYHDWNEKITAECYFPNSSSHILDKDGFISQIVNNYSKISFDFGPTLLAWMEKSAPDIYRAIIEADKQSMRNFSGHGSAMAQAYNHIIMPLANTRDRYSQVLWGIRDFEHRFGRKPEGMWLPETAVDLETLDMMAQLGIAFTVLAPHQVKRVRRIGSANWRDLNPGEIDPSRAYKTFLPSGRVMNVFFYDGPLSRSVAFEDTLKSGEAFARRLTGAFQARRYWPQLVHIATDGETYGHHHRFTDMALAFAIRHIESNNLAKITNYGEYLEKYPPQHEVEITEKTSWSCAHGIDRWWSDCGDSTSTNNHPGWNQKWRTPLRNALDLLRDNLSAPYEEKTRQYLKDPWAARDDYIDVVLDRSPASVQRFFDKHTVHELNESEKVTALKLLELQRHAMLMYTSCGWFFDEISRPEPVQVIQYAGRVIQLAQELFGDSVEERFLKILEEAKSNIPAQGSGRRIYDNFVRPAMITLEGVAAHYAVGSLFRVYGKEARIACYTVDSEDYQRFQCGQSKLAVGKARFTSEITGETTVYCFGAFHPGGHVVNAGVRLCDNENDYRQMVEETAASCARGNLDEVVRQLENRLGGAEHSLKSLFRDEQRRIMASILESSMSDIEDAYRQLYEYHYPPMRFLSELGGPVPRAFHAAAELIINIDLRRAVTGEAVDETAIKKMVGTAKEWQIHLDSDIIGYEFKCSLDRMMKSFASTPGDTTLLKNLSEALATARGLPFPIDLNKVQDTYWQMLSGVYPEFKQKAAAGDKQAMEWVDVFTALGKNLLIKV